MTHEDRNPAPRVIGGLILLSLGVLFLLQNFGAVRVGRVWDYWPMLLVWGGLARLFSPRRGHHFAAGAVILLLGVFLQLEELGFVWIRARDFWPALLVAAGLALVAESLVVRRRKWYDGSSYGGTSSGERS